MTIRPNPTRLDQDPRLGRMLRSAQRQGLSPRRLKDGEQRLRQHLAAASPLATAAASAAGVAAKGLLVLIPVAGAAWLAAEMSGPAPTPSRPPDRIYRATKAPAPRVPPTAAPAQRPSRPTAARPAPTRSRPRVAVRGAVARHSVHPSPEETEPARRQTRTEPSRAGGAGPGSTTADGLTSPAPDSALVRQIELYDSARRAAANGDHRRAITYLDRLLAAFPESPLRAEVSLSRAEYLIRAGLLEQATAAVRRLVASPLHRGRWPELRRVLGDLLRRQGRCGDARAHYLWAANNSPREAAAAQRGLAACRDLLPGPENNEAKDSLRETNAR